MSNATQELLKSWGRVFLTAALAAYIATGIAPWDIDLEGWKAIAAAGIAATALTVYNYLRPGETRFGHGSDQ